MQGQDQYSVGGSSITARVSVATAAALAALALLVAVAGGAFLADEASAQAHTRIAATSDHLIAWNTDGVVTRVGKITRVDRRGYSGRALRGRLGKPSSRRRTSANSCRYTWKRHSLTTTLSHFGGKNVPCEKNYMQMAEIKGTGGSRWHTAEGLYFGESEDRLRAAYPGAREDTVYGDSVWVIAEAVTPVGAGDTIPTVWAKTRNGRIVKFGIWVGGAGD